MKTIFYIDRQFGHQIFISVEDGIITNFPQEGTMEDRLNIKYVGIGIAQMKEEFESIMKPSYHNVHPSDYANIQRQISNHVNVISVWNKRKKSLFGNFTLECCDRKIEENEIAMDLQLKALKKEAKSLLKNHNFKVK